MRRRRLGRPDGNVRCITAGLHETHRGAGVEVQYLRCVGERLEESGALLETVDRRQHLTDRAERKIADPAQAVVDARSLLTDDRDLVLTEQIVGLVDAPGRGVLDGQHSQVDLACLQRIDGSLVGRCHDQLAIDVARRKILLGGEKAKGVLTAHGDPERNLALHARAAGNLPAHRFRQEITVDPAHQVDRRTLRPCDVLHRRKDLALTLGVADGRVGCRLFAGDVDNHPESLRDQRNDPLVEIVDAIAEGEEFSVRFRHARSLRTKPGRRLRRSSGAPDRPGPFRGIRERRNGHAP